jgi:glycosyltransferase involved in cell wall biosynthesis
MKEKEPLVSVVVPAFNAEDLLAQTLSSVVGQSHHTLAIRTVDDGSTDGTGAIADAFAQADPRVRVIRQDNAGVAAARNRGLAEANGEFLAPIDADDLWEPSKIEKQLKVLQAGGERMALVYTWYAQIDREGKVTSRAHKPLEEGHVLERMCRGNLVGNGSAALLRTGAVREVGGYDPSLRAQGGQGCEDLDLYFKIAERYEFGLVPEHLTGYRRMRGNMSSDILQMYRSREIVAARYKAKYPQYAHAFRDGRQIYLKWLLVRAIDEAQFDAARRISSILSRDEPWFALKTIPVLPLTIVRRKVMRRARHLARAALRQHTADVAFFAPEPAQLGASQP